MTDRKKVIVFAGGCFDLLHHGHVEFLQRARALGDWLVVGLNTDDSIRGLKGPERPVVDFEHRKLMLQALKCVNWVEPIEGRTPVQLIGMLRPDIIVKGPDYDPATMPEAPVVQSYGGRIVILPKVFDVSTTRIVNSIKERCNEIRT